MSSLDRRKFLSRGAIVAAGAAATSLGSLANPVVAAEGATSPEERVRRLGIKLRTPTQPTAPFALAVRVDNMLYLSGHGPRKPDGTSFVEGQVGKVLTVEEAKAAARLTAIDMLSSMRAELGSLDRVVRLVKTTGMVNSGAGFKEHPQVINGFSELMINVFGPKMGKGARSAVGMSGLPFDIAVEIEAIFQVR